MFESLPILYSHDENPCYSVDQVSHANWSDCRYVRVQFRKENLYKTAELHIYLMCQRLDSGNDRFPWVHVGLSCDFVWIHRARDHYLCVERTCPIEVSWFQLHLAHDAAWLSRRHIAADLHGAEGLQESMRWFRTFFSSRMAAKYRTYSQKTW